MLLPRFEISTVDGHAADVDSPRIAATVYAFDVPLHPANPYSTQAGDGISGVRVTWHFSQSNPTGNSPGAIVSKWHDLPWLAANPKNPLAICRSAFRWFDALKQAMTENTGYPIYPGAAVRITNTRKAAVLSALGHPIHGWQRNAQVTTWCFHEAAATDAALFDRNLYDELPDAPISYAKGAMLGHEIMTHAIKDIQFARARFMYTAPTTLRCNRTSYLY
jgi:hypothetical protein